MMRGDGGVLGRAIRGAKTVELCGTVFPMKPGQEPCGKPKGHENGPDTDWKRDLHSNGLLKWRVDGADLPWRFDVPEVPPHVTALADRIGWIWVREGAGWTLWRGSPASGPYRLYGDDLAQRAPLMQCEDPRGRT